MSFKKGQTAVEYLLLLGVVTAIILVGMKTYLPRFTGASNLYFNKAAVRILGDAPRCGNGVVDTGENGENCCVDLGLCP